LPVSILKLTTQKVLTKHVFPKDPGNHFSSGNHSFKPNDIPIIFSCCLIKVIIQEIISYYVYLYFIFIRFQFVLRLGSKLFLETTGGRPRMRSSAASTLSPQISGLIVVIAVIVVVVVIVLMLVLLTFLVLLLFWC
jgi:hypothetical protein